MCREGKLNKLDVRNKFVKKVLKKKDLEKYQIGVVRESIPKPWDDVITIFNK